MLFDYEGITEKLRGDPAVEPQHEILKQNFKQQKCFEKFVHLCEKVFAAACCFVLNQFEIVFAVKISSPLRPVTTSKRRRKVRLRYQPVKKTEKRLIRRHLPLLKKKAL